MGWFNVPEFLLGKNMSLTPDFSRELLQQLRDLMKPFQQEALFTGWESHQDDILVDRGSRKKTQSFGIPP